MNDFGFKEHSERIQYLSNKYSNQIGRQSAKLILLDQFIQVDTEDFKCDAKMVPEYKRILHSHQMMFSVYIILFFNLQYGIWQVRI